ncbi:MAG TPA: NfeD family protein [Conexibacter sp.]|jgi:membrane-bound serine protease (ClpP class)
MVLLAIVLIIAGVGLLVAEAHLPSGALGVGGAIAVGAGAALAIGSAGAGVGLVVVGMLAAAAVAATWVALIARTGLRTRQRRVSSGREALSGQHGVVRSWAGGGGQVLVDGALWRARPDPFDDPSGAPFVAGEEVVVEHVRGLTLTVRRAEEWEVLG